MRELEARERQHFGTGSQLKAKRAVRPEARPAADCSLKGHRKGTVRMDLAVPSIPEIFPFDALGGASDGDGVQAGIASRATSEAGVNGLLYWPSRVILVGGNLNADEFR